MADGLVTPATERAQVKAIFRSTSRKARPAGTATDTATTTRTMTCCAHVQHLDALVDVVALLVRCIEERLGQAEQMDAVLVARETIRACGMEHAIPQSVKTVLC
jgi:hypothetical protein